MVLISCGYCSSAVRSPKKHKCDVTSKPTRRLLHRLTAYATLAVFLSGCAVQPSGPLRQGAALAAPSTQTLRISQKDHNPCSEANRQSEAFAGAIVGGLAGAALGALAGALIAKAIKANATQAAKRGALIGAGAGVFAGYTSGVDSYRRQCDLHKVALRRNAIAAFATLSTGKETTGEIVITPDQGHFFQDSDQLTETGKAYFGDLGHQYTSGVQLASYERTVRSTADRNSSLGELKAYKSSAEDRSKLEARWGDYRIVITGHTDDQRDAAAAQSLSESRAQNVAKLFREQGVPESSILYQGAGAAFPLADNRDPVARQRNNRVEAVVLYDERTLLAYADARTPKYEYFSERVAASELAATNVIQSPPPSSAPRKQASGKASKPPLAPVEKSPTKSATKKADVAAKSLPRAPGSLPSPQVVEPGIDFGGVAFKEYSFSLASRLGAIQTSNDSLMIDTFATLVGVGSAHAASNSIIQSCSADDPLRHRPGQIRRLADSGSITKAKPPISVTESYLFTTVRSVFYGPAGDHFVEVKNVTARKTGELVEEPQFNLYLGYRTKTDEEKSKAKSPDYTTFPVSYALLGQGGLLVRQFFPSDKGLVCMDMLIPNDRSVKTLPDTALVYNQAGVRKVANLTMGR